MNLRILLSQRALSGMWADTMNRELKKHGISEVGVTADFGERFIEAAKDACRIVLYDASESDLGAEEAVRAAKALTASAVCIGSAGQTEETLALYARRARGEGLAPLISSRGTRIKSLAALAGASGARVALDTGYSHFKGSALEDFYDVLPVLGAVFLEDNGGERDDRIAPGYGTLPVGALGEALDKEAPAIDVYLTGTPRQDFPFADPNLGLYLTETRVALSGRVPVNPAGGWLARDAYTGRILI